MIVHSIGSPRTNGLTRPPIAAIAKIKKRCVPWLSSSRSERHVLKFRCQPTPTQPTNLYIWVYIWVAPIREAEISNFHPSSRPLTGARWSPVSGPRPRFLGRSLRRSGSPASTRPIPAHATSGSRGGGETRRLNLPRSC